MSQQAVVTNATPKSLQDLSVEFKTAFHQIEDSGIKFPFDIDKTDSLAWNTNSYQCNVDYTASILSVISFKFISACSSNLAHYQE